MGRAEASAIIGRRKCEAFRNLLLGGIRRGRRDKEIFYLEGRDEKNVLKQLILSGKSELF